MALNKTEFAQKIKAKYPAYNDIPDNQLADKILAKYPQYNDMVKGSNSFGANVLGGITKSVEGVGKDLASYGSGAVAYGLDKLTGSNKYQNYKDAVNKVGNKSSTFTEAITGEQINPSTSLEQAGGRVLSSASNAIPVTKSASLGTKVLQGAGIGALSSAGSAMDNNKSIGDVALDSVMGGLTGSAFPLAGAGLGKVGQGVKNILPTADNLNNRIIKPGIKDFNYGRNPGETMAKYGITGKNLEIISEKTNQASNEVGNKLNELANYFSSLSEKGNDTLGQATKSQVKLKSSIQQPYNLNLSDSFNEIDNGIKSALKSNNTILANKLQQIKHALTNNLEAKLNSETGLYEQINNGARDLNNLSFNDALSLKREIGDHINFTADTSDDMKVNGIIKNLYDNVNKKLDYKASEIDPNLGAKWKELNKDYSGLKSVQNSVTKRNIVERRQNLMGGIQTPLVGLGAGALGMGYSAITGEDPSTMGSIGALSGIGLSIASKNPAIMTNIAKQIYKTSNKNSEKIIESQLSKKYPQFWNSISQTAKNQIIQSFTREYGKKESIGDKVTQNINY